MAPELKFAAKPADPTGMRHELSSDQAVQIALMRQRHPDADVQVRRHIGGLVVEAHEGGKVVELLRADYFGRCESGQQLPHAA